MGVSVSINLTDYIIERICEGKNIFVNGGAGTGKTTLQRSVKDILNNTVSVAPTGIAALNTQGITGHRAFSLPTSIPTAENYTNYMKARSPITKKLFGKNRAVDRVFWDEIGMVRSDHFQMADFALKSIYKNSKPFGGMQMCLFGDLSQIPAVVKSEEASILRQHFGGKYFFQNPAFTEGDFEVIYLHDVKRQDNQEMIQHLNNIRLYGYNFPLKQSIDFFNDNCLKTDIGDATYIVTTNAMCDEINSNYYNSLSTPERKYFSKRTGVFKENPLPDVMSLRAGAKVMTVANHSDGLYVNGSIGFVVDVDVDTVYVEFLHNRSNVVGVKTSTYESYEYFTNKEGELDKKVIGSFSQIPLKLAWGVTLHKCQGLTLDKAYLDFGKSVFAAGMPYVGLSRFKTLSGLSLVRPLRTNDIIRDQTILDFYIKTGGLEM